MLIWIVLFAAVLGVSFILAWRSMNDYLESPANFKLHYAPFLVRIPGALTEEVLEAVHQAVKREGLIISFERLFRGEKKALVIFAPVAILRPYIKLLGLLELEDYTKREEITKGAVVAWELGAKDAAKIEQLKENVLPDLPILGSGEELWWQLLAQPLPEAGKFYTVIRVVVEADGRQRAQEFQRLISEMTNAYGLAVLPQPYSTSQLVKLYQERSLKHGLLGSYASRKTALNLDLRQVRFLLQIA